MWDQDETFATKDFDKLLSIAKEHFDGHFTLHRFTTGWKGCFGTARERELRSPLFMEMPRMSLKDVVKYMVEHKPNTYGKVIEA